MGIPEYEAKRYEGRVKDGGILVSVHCDSSEEVSRAKDILKQSGGDDVASSGEKGVSTHTANTDAVVDRTASAYDRGTGLDRGTDYDRTSGYDRTPGYTTTGTTAVDDAAYGTRTGLDSTRDDVLVGDRKPIISTPE